MGYLGASKGYLSPDVVVVRGLVLIFVVAVVVVVVLVIVVVVVALVAIVVAVGHVEVVGGRGG